MPSFRYEAVDGAGRAQRGLLDAASARAVRDQLRGDGLFPTAIEPAGTASSVRAATTHLAAPLLALLTRQLATLVASGMPLDQALAAVAEQSDQPRAARVLAAIREQVAAGEPLAAALSRFPRTFSDLYRGLVAVGAESGQLGGVLSRLADYLEARQVLRAQFTAALIYPALITVIALAVIATLLLYVVPQIVAVYQQSRQALPFLTRALIASSDFLRATGVYWLAAVAVLVAGAIVLLRAEAWRDRRQRRSVVARTRNGRGRRLGPPDAAGGARCRRPGSRRRVAGARPGEPARISAAARAPGRQRRAERPVAGDARPRRARAGDRRGTAPDVARRTGAAAADRVHGRDRAGDGAGRHAADRFDEPVDPLTVVRAGALLLLLRQRPGDMLAHQRRRIIASCGECRDDRGVVVRIAQADGKIAQPARVAYAADRAAFHATRELIRGPGEERHQVGIVETVAHGEIPNARGLGVLVPRTRELAVVAAVDSIADQRAQGFRNAALELDRQVGNAAARVQLVRRDNGTGGAGGYARAAAAAMRAGRGRDRQRQIGVDLAQKEERAGIARQQQRVLAAPAQARL